MSRVWVINFYLETGILVGWLTSGHCKLKLTVVVQIALCCEWLKPRKQLDMRHGVLKTHFVYSV